MTKELDTAHIAEALRRTSPNGPKTFTERFGQHLCDLFHAGWTPPVDLDLIVARQMAAAAYPDSRPSIVAGEWDSSDHVVGRLLAAIKMGRKLAQDESARDVIRLTPAEIQSRYSRVAWAEALIRQLPETHEGRNSWLLNYGKVTT